MHDSALFEMSTLKHVWDKVLDPIRATIQKPPYLSHYAVYISHKWMYITHFIQVNVDYMYVEVLHISYKWIYITSI